MPAIDLLGQKFGKLTVLKRDLSKTGGAAYWICECECDKHTILSVKGQNLRNGDTQSCGCLRKERAKIDTTSLLNKTFGRLTVISRDLTKPIGHGEEAYWNCKCECGNIISVRTASLKGKHTQSCGCLRSELRTKNNTKDISNLKIGYLIPLENTYTKNSHNSYIWRCLCTNCGNDQYYCSTEDLLGGNVHSCGCKHRSMGEIKINQILIENNIHYVPQYSFEDLKSKHGRYLKYDFAILDNQNQVIRLIEFDGQQHFDTTSYYYTEEGIERDEQKNNYAKTHNIPLVRIPYDELNNLSLELLLSDTKYLI